MTYLTYILAGIRNKRGRNLAAAFCFALIAANLFSGQFLISGEVGSVEQGVSRLGADLLVVPAEYTRLLEGATFDDTMAIVTVLPSGHRFDGGILDRIREVPGVAGVSPQLSIAAVSIPDRSPSPIDVYGIDPTTDFTVRSWLQHPLDRTLGSGEVLIGRDIRGSVGETIAIAGRSFVVAGVLDETRSGIDRSVFVPLEDARLLASAGGGEPRIAPGDVSAGLVRVAPGEDPEAVALRIDRIDQGGRLTVIGRHFSLDPVSQNMQGLPGVLNAISAIVLIAAFPLVALIAAMVAHERRREIGLLRAMGAKGPVIALLVMAESLALASLGAVAGIGASLAMLFVLDTTGVLNSALQVSFRMPTAAGVGLLAGITFLVVIAMATFASLYPAYRSSTMNPFDAIRHGGR